MDSGTSVDASGAMWAGVFVENKDDPLIARIGRDSEGSTSLRAELGGGYGSRRLSRLEKIGYPLHGFRLINFRDLVRTEGTILLFITVGPMKKL